MNQLLRALPFMSLTAPVVAFAAPFDNVTPILKNVKNALDVAVPVAITLALIYFIWGVIQYVISQDEEKKTDARQKIIWGIIGMFVIVAIWGIVNFVGAYLGVTPTGTTIIPGVPY